MAENFACGTLEWKCSGADHRIRYRAMLGAMYDRKLSPAEAEAFFFQRLKELREDAVRLTLSGYWPRSVPSGTDPRSGDHASL